MAEGESAACTNSFVAGTPVATPNGEQSIETLKVGDKVLAENPDTGEKGYYPITYTTHHLATDGLVLITIGSVSTNENKPAELFVASGIAGASTLGSASGSSSGSGPGSVTSSETIKATPQHPFWVPGRGWINAGDLQPGDQLLSSDGRSLTVEATEVVSEQSQVYNFTVDQFHTYFVGQQQTLVHNTNCTYVEVYHGTSKAGAANIKQKGINPFYFAEKRDFGKGFYTTIDRNQAEAWASRTADGGEVLTFRLDKNELNNLSGYKFRGTSNNWEDFVIRNRINEPISAQHVHYDYTSGTMLLNPSNFILGLEPLKAGGQQTTWYTQRAFDMLMQGLVK